MADFAILSLADLHTAKDGWYYIAGDDNKPIQVNGFRMVAHVADQSPVEPVGVQSYVIRSDGKAIITQWEVSDAGVSASAPVEVAAVDVPEPKRAICPNCGDTLSAPVVNTLTICRNCRRTVAIEHDLARLAINTDTLNLAPDQIKTLKALRREVRA